VSETAVAAAELHADDPAVAPFANRFLLVTVAFRRVVQIREGARPRVHVASRKPSVLAVAEVLAGCVTFSTDDSTPADHGRS
jgi:DNA-directed RNA polymerase subunit K/omega